MFLVRLARSNQVTQNSILKAVPPTDLGIEHGLPIFRPLCADDVVNGASWHQLVGRQILDEESPGFCGCRIQGVGKIAVVG
jgi:hypothetical protein